VNGISTKDTLSLGKIQELLKVGRQFAFRYYCSEQTGIPEKIFRPGEATLLAQAGLIAAVVYEFRAGAETKEDPKPHPHDFDVDKATRDAGVALTQARAVGQPEGSAIYFAVDYDFTDTAVLDRICNYFAEVETVFRQANGGQGPYVLGVYGSGLVCRTVKARLAAVRFSFVAESTGWSGTHTYTDWAVKQSASDHSIPHLDYEDCEAPGYFGGFIPWGTPAMPAQNG
jgi:hypothetical protein